MTHEPLRAAGAGRSGERRFRWLREMWASTIGKKVIVAATGIILAAWIILHALGNLKAVQGPGNGSPAIDGYAEWLRNVGHPLIPHNGLLWTVRVILIVSLVLHVTGVLQLAARNRAARADGYRPERLQRSLASRTMLITGIAIFAFLVFHLLQFTFHTIQVTPVHSDDVYANLYNAFQEWYFVVIYVVAVAILGLHLYHAIWSTTQTAGIDKPNRNPTFRRASTIIGVGVAVTFASVPILFFTGALPEPVNGGSGGVLVQSHVPAEAR